MRLRARAAVWREKRERGRWGRGRERENARALTTNYVTAFFFFFLLVFLPSVRTSLRRLHSNEILCVPVLYSFFFPLHLSLSLSRSTDILVRSANGVDASLLPLSYLIDVISSWRWVDLLLLLRSVLIEKNEKREKPRGFSKCVHGLKRSSSSSMLTFEELASDFFCCCCYCYCCC